MGIAMVVGNYSARSGTSGFLLPSYIGAMIVAALIRKFWTTDSDSAQISQVEWFAGEDRALPVHCDGASDLAVVNCRIWRAVGGDSGSSSGALLVDVRDHVLLGDGTHYESAVMASGFCGFMLGITAKRIACMEELVDKFGRPHRRPGGPGSRRISDRLHELHDLLPRWPTGRFFLWRGHSCLPRRTSCRRFSHRPTSHSAVADWTGMPFPRGFPDRSEKASR